MQRERGFILITTTLVLLALSVTLAAATFSFSLGSTVRSLALERGEVMLASADGCMEEALFRIRNDANFSSTTLDLGGVACVIDVTRSDNNYSVTTQVTSQNHTRRAIVEANRTASRMVLSSWRVE